MGEFQQEVGTRVFNCFKFFFGQLELESGLMKSLAELDQINWSVVILALKGNLKGLELTQSQHVRLRLFDGISLQNLSCHTEDEGFQIRVQFDNVSRRSLKGYVQSSQFPQNRLKELQIQEVRPSS